MKKRNQSARQRSYQVILTVLIITVVAIVGWNIYANQPAPMIEQFGPSKPNGSVPASFILQRADLEPFRNWGGTEALAESTLRRLPRYERLIAQLNDLRKYEFDVILQEHDVVGNDPNGLNRVRRSQRRVFATLEELRADVIMVEGIPLDRITRRSLKSYALDAASRQGQFLSPVMYDQGFKNSLPFDGTMRYLVDYPDAIMVGAEDEVLNLFHDKVLYILDNAYMNYAERDSFATISTQLKIARSIVAVCRSVEALKQYHGRRAAIVIGYAHGPEIAATIQRFGGRARIYNATK